MNICKDDYMEILNYMVQQHWGGNGYVAYPNDGAAVLRDDLFYCGEYADVKKFCELNTNDDCTFEFLAIRSVYRAMNAALHDKNLIIEKHGYIDVAAMVSARIKRFEEQELFNNKNYQVMNQKNLQYLQDQVMYTGFGEGLAVDLKQNLERGSEQFQLKHEAKYGNDTVEATLNFSKSKESDMYFFNSYNATLHKDGQPEKLEQTFYINKGSNITLKEAYNLMEGRSVNKNLTNKDSEQYNAWVKLDFEHTDDNGNFRLRKFGENFGYDLDAVLSARPIKELLRDDFKDDLIDSLKKGNLQSVTFMVDGNEQKHFVAADPQFKTLKVYDANMEKIGGRQEKSERASQKEGESSNEKKKEGQKATENDADSKPQKNANKRKGKNHSV